MITLEYVTHTHIYTHTYTYTHIEEDHLGFWKLKISALSVGNWGYNTIKQSQKQSLR